MLLTLLSLIFSNIPKSTMKTAYQNSGCCPLLNNYNKCSIVHVTGAPYSGFTCDEVQQLYCNAINDTIIIVDPCDLCYGIHTDTDCLQ